MQDYIILKVFYFNNEIACEKVLRKFRNSGSSTVSVDCSNIVRSTNFRNLNTSNVIFELLRVQSSKKG